MSDESQKVSCPNCLAPAVKEGNEITCETCDAVFVITKKEGAKVKKVGLIDDHEKRISRLESIIPDQEPVKPDEPVEPEEEPILG